MYYRLYLPLSAAAILLASACSFPTVDDFVIENQTSREAPEAQQQPAHQEQMTQQVSTVEMHLSLEELTTREQVDLSSDHALLEVREPAGAICDVHGDTDWNRSDARETPFQFHLRKDEYVGLSCAMPNGQEFSHRFRPEVGKRNVVTLASSGAQAQSPPPQPTATPQPSGGQVMSDARFQELLAQVSDESFSSGKLDAIESAAYHNHFTASQVAQLLGEITMAGDQVKVVEMTAPKIVDRENEHLILGEFTFDSARQEAAEILRAQ